MSQNTESNTTVALWNSLKKGLLKMKN